MENEFAHRSVLLEQAVDALLVDPSGCYLDCTFGRGGHSAEILSRLNERNWTSIKSGRESFTLILAYDLVGKTSDIQSLL